MSRSLLLISVLALASAPVQGQSRPAPTLDPAATAAGTRPLPGPVYESPGFTQAVARGTRTRTGMPGPRYWVQHPLYRIEASLDTKRNRVTGRESVVYRNNSPDTLSRVALFLRQNVFAPGSPRRDPAPITGGVTLGEVTVDGQPILELGPGDSAAGLRRRGGPPSRYRVNGTIMWLNLPAPLSPGDSLVLGIAWSYQPPPAPSDGRQGRDGRVFFMGYWYPQFAVYDDVDGWVTDPYVLEAEFYMDPADYDVKLTVDRGWVVGATGTLVNAAEVLSRAALDSLALARTSGRVIRVLTPGAAAGATFARGGSRVTWHFTARDVRDFAWGTSDQYAWDATRALVGAGGRDTVNISSFFRLTTPAAAWALGGARFTRDAIHQLSADLWPYPWPQMTSMEGVLESGGMEYPMMTLMQPWADTLSLAGDLMHETGHMWFPMQVGSNETRSPWMDEGFTQYNVAQAMRVIYGEPRVGGRPNDTETGQRLLYLRTARAGLDHPLMVPGNDYPESLYFIMQYNKTAQVLAALRGVLGRETFHRAFVEYGRRWIGRHPAPWDFFNSIEDLSGQHLSWFWETWFHQGWPLDQAVDSVTVAGDSVAIAVSDRGLAPMPVRLAVTRADGSVQRVELPVTVWLGGSRHAIARVSGTPRVVRVEIDPDADFPDIDRANQSWPGP